MLSLFWEIVVVGRFESFNFIFCIRNYFLKGNEKVCKEIFRRRDLLGYFWVLFWGGGLVGSVV